MTKRALSGNHHLRRAGIVWPADLRDIDLLVMTHETTYVIEHSGRGDGLRFVLGGSNQQLVKFLGKPIERRATHRDCILLVLQRKAQGIKAGLVYRESERQS